MNAPNTLEPVECELMLFVCGVAVGEKPGDWVQSCDHLVSSLDDYSDSLMIHLGEFYRANDTEGVSIVWSTCITCLSHLAVLYYFIGETRPNARATMNGLCDAALDNLGNLTQGMKLEEVTSFDLLLKVPDFAVKFSLAKQHRS